MPRGTGTLQRLARDLGADERSLRRAVGVGTLQCRRPSPRRLELDGAERNYLQSHWPILSGLRAALRTEPNVRTAVLFGSVARGTDTDQSDVDLLVELGNGSLAKLAQIEARLGDHLGREIQAVRLRDAEANPHFLYTILQEGRPLLDRDGTWADIRKRTSRLERRAATARTEQSNAARAAFESLIAVAR